MMIVDSADLQTKDLGMVYSFTTDAAINLLKFFNQKNVTFSDFLVPGVTPG